MPPIDAITPAVPATSARSTKIAILIAICCAAAAMPLTFTGPAVALPAIARTLAGNAGALNPVALNWVTNAFMLTFGSCLLAAGSLADSYGRKRVFLIGLSAFTLFSAALAFAPDILTFDILRALQGVGAATTFSSGMAALAQEYDGSARMRAFSFVGASFGIGLAFGPITSGLMIDMFGWPAIFALVVGLGLISLGLGGASMRESRDPAAAGLDWSGTITFTLALTLFTFGILSAPDHGWDNPLVIALLIGAALLMALFCFVERSVARPMLDLSLFRYPRFVGVQLLAAAPAYAFVVLLILLPIRFVGIDGMSEIDAGRMMIALSGPLLILPVIAGYLTRWFTPSTICGLGLAISACGLFWLSHGTTGTSHAALVGPMLTIGIGISLPWGLMDGLAVSVVPTERAGMAAGIFATTRVAGEGVALAIVTVILSALTRSSLGPAHMDSAAAAQRLATGDLAGAQALLPDMARDLLVRGYTDGFNTLLWLLTAVTSVTALVVLLFLRRGAALETADDGTPSEDTEQCLSASNA
ncbi:MAG TPA: MFS transporter [Dongiaceae bacterium]|nr:MFS transporter [Dongiaceae bacterium]